MDCVRPHLLCSVTKICWPIVVVIVAIVRPKTETIILFIMKRWHVWRVLTEISIDEPEVWDMYFRISKSIYRTCYAHTPQLCFALSYTDTHFGNMTRYVYIYIYHCPRNVCNACDASARGGMTATSGVSIIGFASSSHPTWYFIQSCRALWFCPIICTEGVPSLPH